MKNTFGNLLQVTLFGESHGEMIGCVIDGLPAGIKLDLEFIKSMMEKRKAKGKISTKRIEQDELHIVSGYFNEHTTGTPLTILIENQNTRSKDYAQHQYRLRPSHADFSAFKKYHGYQDYRGGGHFSGRITAALVAAGAIATQILQQQNIFIGSHLLNIHGIKDDAFASDFTTLQQQIQQANAMDFSVLNPNKKQQMIACIEEAANHGDSVGGIIESAIYPIPTGIGEPFFHSIESTLSHLLFSIPAVKGVSFGLGFDFANYYGSEVNDAYYYKDGIKTKTNHNGGINGGISNGMPIILQTVIKPTPSIFKEQDSVDYYTKEEVKLQIQGRHDPAIIHRARVVVDSVLALGILDLYMEHLASEGVRKN